MFHLKKHYFDGIDQQGNLFIIYDAALTIGGISIPYSSIITQLNGKNLEHRRLSRLKRSDAQIRHNKLNFNGSWLPLSHISPLTLYQRGKRRLIWHCHTAKADFELEFAQQTYRGLGYAETLEMNFAPWLLPISELRWGRFLSANHSIVWIEWLGETTLKKLIWNGELIENFEINDNVLLIKEKQLSLYFRRPMIIKDEPLVKITERFKFLRFLIKKSFLQSRESKWKSEAELSVANQTEKALLYTRGYYGKNKNYTAKNYLWRRFLPRLAVATGGLGATYGKQHADPRSAISLLGLNIGFERSCFNALGDVRFMETRSRLADECLPAAKLRDSRRLPPVSSSDLYGSGADFFRIIFIF